MDTLSAPECPELAARWRLPWDALGVAPPQGAFEDLLHRHAEPHRHYHGIAHVAQVVDWLSTYGACPALVLAGWFHDAIHVPGRTDSELRSAALAADVLRRAGVGPAQVELAHAAILATASHDDLRDDLAPLLDADLSILGAPAADYARYAAGIRREYAHVPDLLFRFGRARFLRGLLARPHIFRTPVGRERHEATARTNLAAECAALERP